MAPSKAIIRVKFIADPENPTWNIQLQKMGGWQTLAYHIEDKDDAVTMARALGIKYARRVEVDHGE
jgi:hypothetical protein